jgi:hypothetical protein
MKLPEKAVGGGDRKISHGAREGAKEKQTFSFQKRRPRWCFATALLTKTLRFLCVRRETHSIKKAGPPGDLPSF